MYMYIYLHTNICTDTHVYGLVRQANYVKFTTPFFAHVCIPRALFTRMRGQGLPTSGLLSCRGRAMSCVYNNVYTSHTVYTIMHTLVTLCIQ
jgi:hypothetical protein